MIHMAQLNQEVKYVLWSTMLTWENLLLAQLDLLDFNF